MTWRRQAVQASGLALLAVVVAALGWSTISSASANETSQRFWASLWVNGREWEYFEDLTSMAQSADLVVVGRLIGVTEGRVFRDPDTDDAAHYASATLRIERVLTGPVQANADDSEDQLLTLELFLPEQGVIETLRRSVTGERALFFLRDKELEAATLGLPPEVQTAQRGFYRLVSSQGLLRDWNGAVQPPVAAEDSFLLRLAGSDFATLVEEVDAGQ